MKLASKAALILVALSTAIGMGSATQAGEITRCILKGEKTCKNLAKQKLMSIQTCSYLVAKKCTGPKTASSGIGGLSAVGRGPGPRFTGRATGRMFTRGSVRLGTRPETRRRVLRRAR